MCCCDKVKGSEIFLLIFLVGVIENIIFVFIFCDGEVVIKNVVKELEIVDFCYFLNKFGVKIRGVGIYIIKIEGVRKLKSEEVVYKVIFDRIVVGIYLCVVVVCGGEVVLKNVFLRYLDLILYIFKSSGCKIKELKNEIWIKREERLKGGLCIIIYYYFGFFIDF